MLPTYIPKSWEHQYDSDEDWSFSDIIPHGGTPLCAEVVVDRATGASNIIT